LSSFNSFGGEDLLFLSTAWMVEGSVLRAGVEAEFSDYSHELYDNEFHLGIMANYSRANFIRIGLRIPYRWSWWQSLSEIFRTGEFTDRGWNDIRFILKFQMVDHRRTGFGAAFGLIYINRSSPQFFGDEPRIRRDLGILEVFSITRSRTVFTLNLMYVLTGEDPEYKFDNLFHGGIGVGVWLKPAFQIIAELTAEQSFPRYLNNTVLVDDRRVMLHRWYTWNLGFRRYFLNKLELKMYVSLSLLQGNFDLARDGIQIIYKI
jgi:hypothetical protein